MMATWDLAVVQSLAAARTPLLLEFFSLATNLGGALVVVLVCIGAFFIFEESKRWAYGAGMLAALVGSFAIAEALKEVVARERPPIALRALTEVGYSFPSEHAAAAAALYGFLAFAAWTIGPRTYRAPLVLVSIAAIVLVAFSRVYVGVHYPSDVIAGCILGVFCAGVGAHITVRLRTLTTHRKLTSSLRRG